MDGPDCDYDDDLIWSDRTGPHFRADIAGMVNEIRPVKDIIETMMNDANALLKNAKEIC